MPLHGQGKRFRAIHAITLDQTIMRNRFHNHAIGQTIHTLGMQRIDLCGFNACYLCKQAPIGKSDIVSGPVLLEIAITSNC